jgi:uncharacterized protein (DUF2147 family)
MYRSLLVCAALVSSASLSAAQDPIGEWLVKEKVAIIKIDNCNGRIWGIVAWEKEPGGVDRNNPDPAKRRRPTLGMPVLLGMKPTLPNRWEGEIYNAKDGKTYAAHISLSGPNTLRVEGCLLGFLCGGEEWTRVHADARPAHPDSRQPGKSGGRAAPKQEGRASPKHEGRTPPKQEESDVCSRITGLAGGPQQGRLE